VRLTRPLLPDVLFAVPSLGWGEVLARLALAAALGASIGFERELREREAGLRTHLLVCMGSALFTIVSAYGFHDFLTEGGPIVRADPTRIAAQIVTGIGFLGAGAIIRQGISVRGLTTAATLWVAAAIGMSAGAGYYSGAVLGTVITVLALGPLRIAAFRIFERMRPEERNILVQLRQGTKAAELLDALERGHARVEHFQLEDQPDRRVVTLTLDTPSEKLLADLADLDFVQGVEWVR
jgi:putative Mg2+ transporter-C (MgtC) family protein